jgi:hypothetical protein
VLRRPERHADHHDADDRSNDSDHSRNHHHGFEPVALWRTRSA